MKYKTDEIRNMVKNNLNPKRFDHTIRVLKTALEIGNYYNIDAEKIKIAALLHDYAKNYTLSELLALCDHNNVNLNQFQLNNKELIHSVLGAAMVQNIFEINDDEILNAIKNHTTGRENMSILEMIIYVSDFCEPGRKIPDALKVYELAKINLEEAMYMALNSSLKYLLNSDKQIDLQSIECRNWLLNEK